MRAVIVAALLVGAASAIETSEKPLITEDMVNSLNKIPSKTWTATASNGPRVDGASRAAIRRLLGVKADNKAVHAQMLKPRVFTAAELAAPIPDSFDSATNWPNCPTITQIRDQSDCGSCWAVGGASAMSDRACTTANIANLTLSAADLMSCCWSCGSGCNGGYPAAAWSYWVSTGLMTTECQPYPFPKCSHHVVGQYPPCGKTEYPTPACKANCYGNGTATTTKHFGATSYGVSGAEAYQRELMTRGPFEVAFDVYADFPTYKSGVYTRQSSDFLGGHAVRIVGWGTLNGTPYWKIANSWNDSWGMDGYFLILRGSDECGIETSGAAGTAKN